MEVRVRVRVRVRARARVRARVRARARARVRVGLTTPCWCQGTDRYAGLDARYQNPQVQSALSLDTDP